LQFFLKGGDNGSCCEEEVFSTVLWIFWYEAKVCLS
jgi:hypothetical protein